MKTELKNLLARGLTELGLESEALFQSLITYFEELLLWNPRVGLVNAGERELVVKHFLDSAAAAFWFEEFLLSRTRGEATLADLGSGAGLPGVVLALIFRDQPNFHIHLIEKQRRRCSFLYNLLPILGLRNSVQVHEQRAENLNLKMDIVTSRAYRKLSPTQCKLQMGLLKPDGKITAYKGRRETILTEFGGRLPDESHLIPLHVPFLNEERHLLVLNNFLS